MSRAPENTLAAYELAIDLGFDWIETDVRLTRDDKPVMIHDPLVDRTTNGTGHVCLMDFDDLRALDARAGHDDYAGAQIASLDETLTLCVTRDLGMVLEIKPIWGDDHDHGRIVAERIAAIVPQDFGRLVVSSFSVLTLAQLRADLPWLPLVLATESVPRDPARLMDELGVCGFHMNYELGLAQGFDHVLRAGAHTAFATINTPDPARELLKRGAHGIMTDMGDLLG
ncbi:glycerophosphodiester phosphodiesterase family protein [Paracoccus sp. (in: a-proteobacteria)]|uniref:glycerophosphodiester phosphodiesterase n=1 Tax=Paracoccus sp. TaxID=267 RepID=UPI0026E0E1B0|nr:glycerophosphodiester phosphodiesterase family protein [Paracoccus sp. (in: a-proteobacteria)]MDO5647527.1 glycerophosphodiester phosphodiesterase family protein [Paracoccus sp. (in: a-proteobacteria)]